MTYPASGAGVFTGNYGPSIPNAGTVGIAPPYGAPGAAANVAATVPSPATFNFTNSETSTQNIVTELIEAQTDATAWAAVDATNPPTPPGLNIAQTTPAAPTGTFVQSGLLYIVNAASVQLAGVGSSGFTYFTGINDAKG